LAGIPSDPMEALVANMIGGSKIQATGPYDIHVDARSNMLIINANRVDHLTIQELLPILDRLGRTDAAITPKPHLIKLEYMKAEDAETAVRTIFAENLQGAGGNRGGNPQQGGRGQQPNFMLGGPGGMMEGGPQAFMEMLAQRAQGGRNPQGQGGTQAEVQTMTLAVEKTTNSLIVYSPEELFLQVEAFVKELDRMSQSQEPTTNVVRYDQNSATYISNTLRAMLGNSVTVTNQSTTGSNRNTAGGNRAGGGGFTGGMPGGMMGGGGGMMMPGMGGMGAAGGARGGFTGGGMQAPRP
jgi:type II secretory pathway component GspD/PulD (secretin)